MTKRIRDEDIYDRPPKKKCTDEKKTKTNLPESNTRTPIYRIL